jgi:transposase
MYITRARTLRFPQFNMHPISSAQKENIISLASNGLPTRQIASKLGVGKSTVSRVLQDLLPNRQTPSSGRPARLSPTNKRSIITQITTGRSSNAVQATKHINTIISHPVSPQTVRNRVAEVWNDIEPEVCQRLIESMPRRLEAVIKAKGGHTKY